MAMAAGRLDPFNDAISLMIEADTQEELDRIWDALQQGGGRPVACGWLKDRYGVSWQITPRRLNDDARHRPRSRQARGGGDDDDGKLDIAELERAFGG